MLDLRRRHHDYRPASAALVARLMAVPRPHLLDSAGNASSASFAAAPSGTEADRHRGLDAPAHGEAGRRDR